VSDLPEQGLTGAAAPVRLLDGAEESSYVSTVLRVLRAARLNTQYPDARALASHVGALAPEVHRGLYPGLEVDLRSGLPSYKEWTRVQTDVRIAAEQLRGLGHRDALVSRAGRGSEIHARQLAKHGYYSDLAGASLAPLGEMTVALRRVEPEARRASFRVVLDKLDARGFFVRSSIDLAQTSDAWTERAVVLGDDAARQTEGFQSLIYELASLDSELTFITLTTTAGLEVERVVKGTVGPFCFAWTRGPEDVTRVLAGGRFVAMFALDMASIDLASDRDNDPFEDLVFERFSPEARREYERTRERHGYKVFKDRKLVVSADLVSDVRSICAARGTRNVVYST
jgi:hypothetical protein